MTRRECRHCFRRRELTETVAKTSAPEQLLSLEKQELRLLHAIGRKILAESDALGRLEEFVRIAQKRPKSLVTFSQKLLSHFLQRLRMHSIQDLQPKTFRGFHSRSPSSTLELTVERRSTQSE